MWGDKIRTELADQFEHAVFFSNAILDRACLVLSQPKRAVCDDAAAVDDQLREFCFTRATDRTLALAVLHQGVLILIAGLGSHRPPFQEQLAHQARRVCHLSRKFI